LKLYKLGIDSQNDADVVDVRGTKRIRSRIPCGIALELIFPVLRVLHDAVRTAGGRMLAELRTFGKLVEILNPNGGRKRHGEKIEKVRRRLGHVENDGEVVQGFYSFNAPALDKLLDVPDRARNLRKCVAVVLHAYYRGLVIAWSTGWI